MKISTATAKGRRNYQEDRSFVLNTEQGTYFGVFDGHGGSECAEYCAKRMPEILNGIPYLRLALAVLNLETQHMHDGSTASIVFIPNDQTMVHVAVIGDSPVIVKCADGTIWVSPEHNVRTNVAEANAAKARGGFIHSGYLFANTSDNGLQMSRALGDASLNSVLSREPEVFSHVLGADGFILVATDGAFDPSHTSKNALMNTVSRIDMQKTDAQDIVDAALAVPTGDNVTAILVTL